jgi:hypothetical protein
MLSPNSVQADPTLQVSGNMDRPLNLSAIRLAPPPPTTRSSFLNAIHTPFLSGPHRYLPSFLHPAPPPPRTLHEILLSIRALTLHLDQFGIFDMNQLGVRLEHKPGGEEDEVVLALALKEKSRFYLKAGTEIGGGEGGGVGGLPDVLRVGLADGTEYHGENTECVWRRRVARGTSVDRDKDKICIPGPLSTTFYDYALADIPGGAHHASACLTAALASGFGVLFRSG